MPHRMCQFRGSTWMCGAIPIEILPCWLSLRTKIDGSDARICRFDRVDLGAGLDPTYSAHLPLHRLGIQLNPANVGWVERSVTHRNFTLLGIAAMRLHATYSTRLPLHRYRGQLYPLAAQVLFITTTVVNHPLRRQLDDARRERGNEFPI